MFKNCVLNVDTIAWLKGAGIRAAKTFAQAALSLLTVGQAFYEVDWLYVGAVATTAGIISILTSVVGIPEVGNNG